jgi:hypothetical protein
MSATEKTQVKNWGVRDTSGFFGPDPFLAETEAEAREIAGDDSFAVIVRRDSEAGDWRLAQ